MLCSDVVAWCCCYLLVLVSFWKIESERHNNHDDYDDDKRQRPIPSTNVFLSSFVSAFPSVLAASFLPPIAFHYSLVPHKSTLTSLSLVFTKKWKKKPPKNESTNQPRIFSTEKLSPLKWLGRAPDNERKRRLF